MFPDGISFKYRYDQKMTHVYSMVPSFFDWKSEAHKFAMKKMLRLTFLGISFYLR